ncbi:hypothetical protein ADUPG1_001725, partial [Aduncisulcus paluster]
MNYHISTFLPCIACISLVILFPFITLPFVSTISVEILSPSDCISPNNYYVDPDGVQFCVSVCTKDQTFNSTTGVCDAVDCSTKYLGSKETYNSSTGLCESDSSSDSTSDGSSDQASGDLTFPDDVSPD